MRLGEATGRASAPSLVGGSKSSTAPRTAPREGWPVVYTEQWEIDRANRLAAAAAEQHREGLLDTWQPGAAPQPEPEPADLTTAGRFLELTCENWRAIELTDDGAPFTPLNPERAAWRAVVVTESAAKSEPPRQSGDRWTEQLSTRAKKQIEYSAKYMHRMGRGYRTFLTLTFREEWRAQIEKWDQLPRDTDEERRTIGNLVTEFINVLQQRHRNGSTFAGHYRRAGKQKKGGGYFAQGDAYTGKVVTACQSARWTPIKWRDPFKLPENKRPFEFVWVAENPENDQGERNPHIHLLMNWHVKLDQFHAWSTWIEKTWGKGFAKLERIKKPAAAANYMAKAANYISKGTDGEQGPIRGNRYGIANSARAPAARRLGTYFADWIREAVEVGVKAGRDKWPQWTWFHRHGFGCGTRKAWGDLWGALKADGFKFQDPPPRLLAARAGNLVGRVLELSGHWCRTMPAEYWAALTADDVPAWVQ